MELDLHTVKHADVPQLVEDFIFANKPPMYIITGNSDKMKNIVFTILNKHNFKYVVWTHNIGQIVITD